MIAYFVTHPIQYQAPLLRRLTAEGIQLQVAFATSHSAQAHYDSGFAREIEWDVPLLSGYDYTVLDHAARQLPGWWGFRRYLRLVDAFLDRVRPNVIWVHGWGNAFSIAAIASALLRQIPVMVRGESHLRCLRGGWLWRQLHRLVLSMLFKRIALFLSIGTANEEFYARYGVQHHRIVRVPFAADNRFFQTQCREAAKRREKLRAEQGLSPGRPVILFCGKLIEEKDPMTLLKAVELINESVQPIARPYLLLAGDGILRDQITEYAESRPVLIDTVKILGFLNQRQLPAFYDLCDLFVLPSRFEPWGLVVNEALNAGKPAVVSDRVGAGGDLVNAGVNGFIFPAGNAKVLAQHITKICADGEFRIRAEAHDREHISQWSYEADVDGLRKALRTIASASDDSLQSELQVSPVDRTGCPSSENSDVVLAYLGVHEIFQMAIAAAEENRLARLYCSLFDAPNRWGRVIKRIARVPSAFPLGAEALPTGKVSEIPWPLIGRKLSERLPGRKGPNDPLPSNRRFQRSAIRYFHSNEAAIAVGSETCALEWFAAAKHAGAKCLLDCHGIPAPFLDAAILRATEEFGLAAQPPSDSAEMVDYKKAERDCADIIICCSKLQKDIWVRLGETESKFIAVPLWVDTSFWSKRLTRKSSDGVLRVVFAGACSTAKGIPYLLQAYQHLPTSVHLTLVGTVDGQIKPLLAQCKRLPTLLPRGTQREIRDFFYTQDLLVLPSLGDSFGFVAIEAMACGLPVIVTDHCGVPVPDESWRVPAHDSAALAERILHYAGNAQAVDTDAERAADFAKNFTPEKYRASIRQIYRDLLAAA